MSFISVSILAISFPICPAPLLNIYTSPRHHLRKPGQPYHRPLYIYYLSYIVFTTTTTTTTTKHNPPHQVLWRDVHLVMSSVMFYKEVCTDYNSPHLTSHHLVTSTRNSFLSCVPILVPLGLIFWGHPPLAPAILRVRFMCTYIPQIFCICTCHTLLIN